MSDTPRTDSIPRNGAFYHYRVEDVLKLARELERELAVEKDALDQMTSAANMMHKEIGLLHDERDAIGQYLWPDQTGLPNEHRDILTAIKTREKLLNAKLEHLTIREASLCEIIGKMDANRQSMSSEWQEGREV